MRISFSLTIGMSLHRFIVLMVVHKCELCALLCDILSIMCTTYL